MIIKTQSSNPKSCDLSQSASGFKFRPITVAFLSMAVTLSSCGLNADKTSSPAVAQAALEKGDFAAAAIHYKNLLQANPVDGSARLGLGLAALNQGDFVLAQAELERAVEANIEINRSYPALLDTLTFSNQYDKLLIASNQFAAKVPTQIALADYYIGRAHFGLKAADLARASFAKSLQSNPKLIQAQVGQLAITLSSISANDPRNAELIRSIDELSKTAKDSPDAFALLGFAMRTQGRLADAEQALSKSIALRPYDVASRSAYVRVLIDLAQFEAAEKQISELVKFKAGGPMVSYLAGLSAHRQGNADKARELAQDVVSKAPNFVPGLELASEISLEGGELLLAEKYAKSVIAMAPTLLSGQRVLAATYLAMNSPERALAVLAPLVQAKVQTPDILALTGDALIRTGDRAKGIAFLDAASQASGNAPSLAVVTANAKIGLGDVAAGVKLLESAATASKSPQTDLSIARALLGARQFDKAQEVALRFNKAMPKDPQGPYLLGLIKLGNKNTTDATQFFEDALKLNSAYLPAIDALAQLEVDSSQVDKAKERYQSFAKKFPQDVRPFIALARINRRAMGADQETLGYFAAARKANPLSTIPIIEQSLYFIATSRPEQALPDLLALKQKLPNDIQTTEVLARAYEQSGDNAKAIGVLEEALRLDSTSTSLNFWIGNLRLGLADVPGAMSNFKRASELQPSSIEPRVAIASALFSAGKKTEAFAYARAIETQFPNQLIGTSLLGDFSLADAKPADAVAFYQKAFDGNPNSSLAVKLHRALQVSGKVDQARTHLRTWWAANPSDVDFMVKVSETLIEQSAWKEALSVLNEVLKVSKNSSAALNNAALAMHELKEPQALSLAQRAFAIDPHNFAVLDTYGWILVEQGQLEQGLTYLKAAVAKAPKNLAVRAHLNKSLAKAGKA